MADDINYPVGKRVRVIKNRYSTYVPKGYESTIARKYEGKGLTGKPETHYYLAGKFEDLFFREDDLAIVGDS